MLDQMKTKVKAFFKKAKSKLKMPRKGRRAVEAEEMEARVSAAIRRGTFEVVAEDARGDDPGPAAVVRAAGRPPSRGRPRWYHPGPYRYPAEALGGRL